MSIVLNFQNKIPIYRVTKGNSWEIERAKGGNNMLNRISSIRSIERVNRINRTNKQMSQQGSFYRAREEQEVQFSEAMKEACKHNGDSLSRSMENKINFYGSDAQAVYYTMAMSRSFKA